MTAYTTPELPRLIVNGSGKYKYVFTYKNHWVDGRSVRGKGDTRSVGKFVPDIHRQIPCVGAFSSISV